MKKQDILMVGVGGQGTILASDILGEAALAAGYDVKKTDTLGMAQRGGSVVSHVRIAEQVWSPLIKEGEADIMLAFEKLEAARWGRYLRPGGVAIINNHAMPPLSVSLGTHRYPDDEEVHDTSIKDSFDRNARIGTGNDRCVGVVTLIFRSGLGQSSSIGMRMLRLAANKTFISGLE